MSSMGTGGEAPTRDGRPLHFVVKGDGHPTVVFESGMGASRSSWGAVQPVVAERTRAVVYDRAGLGQSQPGPKPRSLDALVADLGALLDHLRDGPYVLVGHSWGGPIVRTLAARRPDDVAGLVLVDQADESCDLYFDPKATRAQTVSTKVMPIAARFGLVRLAMRQASKPLPDDVADEMCREDSTVEAAKVMQDELEPFLDDLRRLRDHPEPLPDVPVTLISGTKQTRTMKAQRTAIVASHRARAESLPQGRHVDAPRSAHNIMLSEPQIVIDEILRLVYQVRSG